MLEAVSYSVGQVAGLAGVSVRALHHYHQIGLLVPSGHPPAGYRRYVDADLGRLQRVLFYRELGFPLEQIVTLLDDPAIDPQAHLRRQHDLLTQRIVRLGEMVTAGAKGSEGKEKGNSPEAPERVAGFVRKMHAEE